MKLSITTKTTIIPSKESITIGQPEDHPVLPLTHSSQRKQNGPKTRQTHRRTSSTGQIQVHALSTGEAAKPTVPSTLIAANRQTAASIVAGRAPGVKGHKRAHSSTGVVDREHRRPDHFCVELCSMKEPTIMMGFNLYRTRHKSRYKHYNPRNYSFKTVLWFTREEIQLLKSVASTWNFVAFLFSFIICISLLIMYLSRSANDAPFNTPEGSLIHYTLGGLLFLQAVISFIGYTGSKTENSCIIDFYIAVKGILIVSYFLVWLIFTNFGE